MANGRRAVNRQRKITRRGGTRARKRHTSEPSVIDDEPVDTSVLAPEERAMADREADRYMTEWEKRADELVKEMTRDALSDEERDAGRRDMKKRSRRPGA